MSIDWLAAQLPPVEPIQRRSEADYYGASDVIATPLGYATPPRSVASWKHGVSYEVRMNSPELLLTEGNRATRHLVANEWQAARLRKAGYLRVHAVGVPFLYAPAPYGARLPGSLLVMPAHHVLNATHAFDEEGYASRIAAIGERFDFVAACVSAACVRSGSWTRAFEKVGIPWIVGADANDRNALRRMRRLFSLFEFVTTNTLGSHLAYAAHCGCRVSIWGPYAQIRLEDYRNVPWYQKHWDRAAELVECYSEPRVQRNHAALFRDPWDAESLKSWADPFLGEEHRRAPAELARLLGWNAIGQTELLVHRGATRLAHLARAALRRARRLSTT